MQVRKIIKITKGKLLSGDPAADIDLATVSTDSRTIRQGEFFLPLKGNNFDGENYIEDAFKKGAIGTFTSNARRMTHDARRITIFVKDTTDALQKIAHAHRMKFNIPIIGVTGSNGKTTTKDMIAAVLSSKFSVLKNEGTKNNHIGLPQTLLKLKSAHKICVLEMGANHAGEIRLLSRIAKPGIAVITNIGPSHLEFLKDLQGVFKAKAEVLESLDRDSLAVLNGDDARLSAVRGKPFKLMRFGFDKANDFIASGVSLESGKIKFVLNDRPVFALNMLGLHNVYNALAAIAVAHNFGLSYEEIKKALAGYAPGYMRLNMSRIGGLTVIDDSYNSNPLSMKCAIEAIKGYPGRARWIVSSDMLELGEKEKEFHRSIGEAIAGAHFDGLVTFGSLSEHTSLRAVECGMGKDRVWHCSGHEEIADILRKVAREGDVILIKGSRAMRMEQVIEKLRAPGVGGRGPQKD